MWYYHTASSISNCKGNLCRHGFYLRDVNIIYINVPLLCVHNLTECDVVIEYWEYSFEERDSSNCKHSTYCRVFCTFNFMNNWAIMKYQNTEPKTIKGQPALTHVIRNYVLPLVVPPLCLWWVTHSDESAQAQNSSRATTTLVSQPPHSTDLSFNG